MPSLGRLYYPVLYPGFEPLWRYTTSEFNTLNGDPTTKVIFDDGGMQIMLIDGTG